MATRNGKALALLAVFVVLASLLIIIALLNRGGPTGRLAITPSGWTAAGYMATRTRRA